MDIRSQLKLETITAPFAGKSPTLPIEEVSVALTRVLQGKSFSFRNDINLPPSERNRLLDLSTAGPNGSIAMRNVIVDAYALLNNPSVYRSLLALAKTCSPYLGELLLKQATILRAILNFPAHK
jgi:hypothetical protein